MHRRQVSTGHFVTPRPVIARPRSADRPLSAEPAYGDPRWLCSQVHHSGDPKRYLSQYGVALLTPAMESTMRAAIKMRIILPFVD